MKGRVAVHDASGMTFFVYHSWLEPLPYFYAGKELLPHPRVDVA
jgi:hypothetical protein